MGAIRGILLVLVSAILFTTLLLTGTFATLNTSLDYDVVKPQITPVVKSMVEEQVDLSLIDDNQAMFEIYCETNSDYNFSEPSLEMNFQIPCPVLLNGSEAVIDYALDSLIQDMYYKEYDCELFKCVEENPMVLVSQHAKDHWRTKYYTTLLIAILIAGLAFLLIQKKAKFPGLIGFLLVMSFLPIARLDSIGQAIAKMMLSKMSTSIPMLNTESIGSIVSIFFSRADFVFLTGFIIGLVLIAVRIFLKLLSVGFKINKLFKSKEPKEPKKE